MRRALILALAVVLTAVATDAAAAGRQERVIGGSVASGADWPSTVAIETAFGSQFCGGSLVAPRWVLTAGHCLLYPSSSVDVLVGSVDLAHGGERIDVVRQLRNPRYRVAVPGAPRHDLMLLRLARASSAPAIAIAADGTGAAPQTLLHVAGWGATSYRAVDDSFGPSSDVLRQTAVRVRADGVCARAYGRAYAKATMLCASLPHRDACAGDSGGPLTRGVGPSALLVGVVSWGTGCALAPYPGVYARVASAHCWIAAVIGPPQAPAAVALAEGTGSLQVDWSWTRPCHDAPRPAGFAVRIAETGTLVRTGPDARRVVLDGLPDGRSLTVAVSAFNVNGEGDARSATATTGANPVLATRVRWTGYRTGTVAFTLAAHAAPVRWRVEAGPLLRVAAGPWHSAAASAQQQTLTVALAGLPVGRAVDVRIGVDEGTRIAHGAPAELPRPLAPALLGRVRVRGAAVVGAVVRCAIGRWTGTRPFEIRRRWLADGRLLRGATGRSLRIGPALAGTRLACRVRVAGPGGIRLATSAGRVVAG